MRGRGRGAGTRRVIGRGASGKPSARSTFARVAREGRTGRTHHDATVGKEGGRGEREGERAPPDLERRERGPGGGYVRNALGSARGGRDGAIERARGETASPRYLPPNARARGARRREECRTWPLRRRRVARVEARRRDRRAGAPAEDRGRGGGFAGDRARLEGARDRLSARARGSIRLVQVSIIIVNFSGPNAIDERTAADALKSVSRLASLVPACVFAPSPLSRWATPRWRTRATGTPPSRRARTSGIGWIRSRTPGGARVAASARRARSRRRLPPTRRTPRRLARRARRSRWRRRWRRSTPPRSRGRPLLRAALELALAACASSGTGETLRDVAFARHGVVRVRELALGRGVGAKLWNAALMLANDIDEHPDWCRGKRVLELGAGVGLCGLLAAKLGAAEVCMTDFEEPLLEALERSARDAEEEDRDEKPEREGGERSPGEKPFAIPRGVARVARCDWREEAAAETEGAAESEAADRSAPRLRRRIDPRPRLRRRPRASSRTRRSTSSSAATSCTSRTTRRRSRRSSCGGWRGTPRVGAASSAR